MKKFTALLVAASFSLSLFAGPSADATKATNTPTDPKQCLKDLESKKDKIAETDKDEQEKKEPSVIDKIAKKHKFSSLHFQDIIELFY